MGDQRIRNDPTVCRFQCCTAFAKMANMAGRPDTQVGVHEAVDRGCGDSLGVDERER